jgi:hypothetical protein
MELLRSSGIEAALAVAVSRGDMADLFQRLERASGVPGPRPNLDLARAVGGAIAGYEKRATPLVGKLVDQANAYLVVVGIMALAARLLANIDERGALRSLHDLAEDERRLVRDGVVQALRAVIAVRGESIIAELAGWTDGYLHAHVALEALADRTLLACLPTSGEVLARVHEAFMLADSSPRAHERSHGLRTLRRGLPTQIVTIASRFSEGLTWLTEQAKASRPETREVVSEAVSVVRRNLSGADADRLAAVLAASAPPPRDPSRIVHGTRKRSKGRR